MCKIVSPELDEIGDKHYCHPCMVNKDECNLTKDDPIDFSGRELNMCLRFPLKSVGLGMYLILVRLILVRFVFLV